MKRVIATAVFLSMIAPAWAGFGEGVDEFKQGNYTAALAVFLPLAKGGDPNAQFAVGEMYSNGLGAEKDQTKAAAWLKKAAAQGLGIAQNSLGYVFRFGEGVRKDDREALRWFRKAALQGIAESQFNLAMHYTYGWGVRPDHVEAVRWFRKAARQGEDAAVAMLEIRYGSVQIDPENAARARFSIEHKFAMAGDTDAQANLGHMYTRGEGASKNDAKAATWFREAAERGHTEAQFMLGSFYEAGQGVPQDFIQAYKWYNLAIARAPDERRKEWVGQRARITRVMTQDQIAEAQKLSGRWKPRKHAE